MTTNETTALHHVREAQNLLSAITRINRVDAETFTMIGHAHGELEKSATLLDRPQAKHVEDNGTGDDSTREDADDVAAELPKVTILAGDLCRELYGLEGVVDALHDSGFEDLSEDTQNLLSALAALTKAVRSGMAVCPSPVLAALDGVAEVHQ